MIRFSDLSLARAGKPLFAGANLSIHPGERIALIGPNGAGKSTLIAALRGELSPERGSIDMPNWRTAWLSQHSPSSTLSAVDYTVSADEAVVRAQREIDAANESGDAIRIAEAYEAWTDCEGASAGARAAELLSGLGFDEDLMHRPVDALSGGWKMRLNLARVLMAPSELMLLDEPTNHLDLDAILWLERSLLRHPATQLIVSHDRDFLDRVATATLAIDDDQLQRFPGGYTASENIRAERAAQRDRERRSNEARIQHLSAFVERFRAKATKARQAQSRLKALERIELIAPLRARRSVSFSFADPPAGPDPLLTTQGLHCGYAGQTIVTVPELTVRRGARIGILGRNGGGKSTLVKTLTGVLEPVSGVVTRASTLNAGYLAQQQVEELDARHSALEHLRQIAPLERDQDLRGFLGQFGFSGDDAMRPVGPMSGGEKTRLTLALLAYAKPGFLILDEPTNHLDADTRDALAEALADFEGALLLVSHDRYLLRATVDEFRIIHGGRLQPFEGDLDDYARWLQTGNLPGAATPGSATTGSTTAGSTATGSTATGSTTMGSTTTGSFAATASPSVNTGAPSSAASAQSPRGRDTPDGPQGADARRERARARTELNTRLAPLKKRIERIETLMKRHQLRATQIDETMSMPGAYDDVEAATERSRERASIARDLEQLEEEWLQVSDEMDGVRAQADA